jgi:hypothetical protein
MRVAVHKSGEGTCIGYILLYYMQLAVVPFISLAIGVDDAYIILGAWQRTDRTTKTHLRVADTMMEAGVPICVRNNVFHLFV